MGILIINWILKEEVIENVNVDNGSAVVRDLYPELDLLDVKYVHDGKVGTVRIFDKMRRCKIGMDIWGSNGEKIENCNIILKYGLKSIYRINDADFVRLEIPYEKIKRIVDKMEEFIELYDLEDLYDRRKTETRKSRKCNG
jgi:hypothetical protein